MQSSKHFSSTAGVSAFLIALGACMLGHATRADHPGLFDTSWMGFDTSTYFTARFPSNGVVADFDNDNDLDCAAIHWWNVPKLSVTMNNGDGTMAAPVQYPAKAAYHLAAADLDNDNYVDIIVSEHGQNGNERNIAVYWNNGDGTFSNRHLYFAGSDLMGLAVDDYDLDHDLDIAVALNVRLEPAEIAVLSNQGGRSFSPPTRYPAGDPDIEWWDLEPWRIASGRLNGDEYPDIVVGNGQQYMTVLINDGAGGFGPPTSHLVPGPQPNVDSGVVLLDVEHDNDLDILYSSGSTKDTNGTHGAVALFRNAGDGTFTGPQMIRHSAGNLGTARMLVADVNHDGWDDVLGVHHDDGGLTVMFSDKQSGFLEAVEYSTGASPQGVAVGDMDLDTDVDIVTFDRDSIEVSVHFNPGNGLFDTPPVYPALYASSMDAADIDLDGDLDIAVAGGFGGFGGAVSTLRNRGDGTFDPAVAYELDQRPTSVKLRNLNEDAYPDLLWIDDRDSPPYNFKTRMNNGDGTFAPHRDWFINTCGSHSVDAFDVDKDGDLDVVVSEQLACFGHLTKALYVSLNFGNGSFAQPQLVVGDTTGLRGINAADFNEDGNLDLIATTALGVNIFPGNGDGTFQDHILIDAVSEGQVYIDAKDINEDGHADITMEGLTGDGSESVWVLLGNGDFTFQAPQRYLSSITNVHLEVADVDGDDDLDLVTASYYGHNFSVFENTGDGTMLDQVRYGTAGRLGEIRVGDFTGDLIPDVAVCMSQIGYLPSSGAAVQILPGTGKNSRYQLELAHTELRRGQRATFQASGAEAGDPVYFLYSRYGTGAGPCPPVFGRMCIDLLNPVKLIGISTANASGIARKSITVPPGAPLIEVHTQAVARRGAGGEHSIKSRTESGMIQP